MHIRKNILVLGALLTVVVGAIARLHPAKISSAKVTSVSPSNPPIANIALLYNTGARPVSVIVDIFLEHGCGSATIGGDQLFVDIPLVRSPSIHRHLVTTATYNMLGKWYTVVQEF